MSWLVFKKCEASSNNETELKLGFGCRCWGSKKIEPEWGWGRSRTWLELVFACGRRRCRTWQKARLCDSRKSTNLSWDHRIIASFVNYPLWNRTKCTLVATADSNKIFLFPFSSGLVLLCNDIKLLWFILQLYVTHLSSFLSLRTLGIFYRVLETEKQHEFELFLRNLKEFFAL